MSPLLLALMLVGARAEPPRAAPLNLIMISLGNVGTRHMSLYGYDRPTTPGLERWARGAAVFEDARSPASWTLPVAASVLTGLAPRSHGLMSRVGVNYLNPAVATLAETLAARGWSTGAFAGGLDYDAGFGHMRGFQATARNLNFERMRMTLMQASRWMRRRSKQPFFVFIHGYDAHCPFVPEAGFQGIVSGAAQRPAGANQHLCGRAATSAGGPIRLKYAFDWCRDKPDCPFQTLELTPALEQAMIGAHDDTVRQIDGRVSAFLDALPLDVTARSVIVVYADHGEMFSKNGRFGRVGPVRGTFYDDVLRVPLMIKAPGVAPRRITGAVELASLPATLLDLLGQGPAPPGAAPSLRPALEAGAAPDVPVFSGMDVIGGEGPFAGRRRGAIDMVVDGPWKLIRETFADGRAHAELYDMRTDRGETRDEAARRPDEVRRLEGLISARALRDAAAAKPPSAARLRDDIRRAARLFGYW